MRDPAQDPPEPADRTDLEYGLRYVHLVSEGLRREVRNGNANLYALADVLIAKGIVRPEELEKARTATEPLVDRSMQAIPPIQLGPNVDKHDPGLAVDVPCGSKRHACRAACCHRAFPLTAQDLQEGGIRWDLYMPYLVERRPDGACIHLGDDLSCTIYERRPAVCRAFDCRKDRRIWDDFEGTIPHREPDEPETPGR